MWPMERNSQVSLAAVKSWMASEPRSVEPAATGEGESETPLGGGGGAAAFERTTAAL